MLQIKANFDESKNSDLGIDDKLEQTIALLNRVKDLAKEANPIQLNQAIYDFQGESKGEIQLDEKAKNLQAGILDLSNKLESLRRSQQLILLENAQRKEEQAINETEAQTNLSPEPQIDLEISNQPFIPLAATAEAIEKKIDAIFANIVET